MSTQPTPLTYKMQSCVQESGETHRLAQIWRQSISRKVILITFRRRLCIVPVFTSVLLVISLYVSATAKPGQGHYQNFSPIFPSIFLRCNTPVKWEESSDLKCILYFVRYVHVMSNAYYMMRFNGK